MDTPQFTVHDFDEVAFLTLKTQPGINFVREKVGGAAIYTISDDAREWGHFAARPGPRISPEVMLKMFSKPASAGAEAPWFAFHSMPHSFEAVDERDRRFRTLCQLIFTRFVMRHGLDMAGRPTTLWDYVQQDEAPSEGDTDRAAEKQSGQSKSKRGPCRYSRTEKIAARQEWDALDRDVYPTTLEEWLEHKFGTSAGTLNVPKSTFYGWPKS